MDEDKACDHVPSEQQDSLSQFHW